MKAKLVLLSVLTLITAIFVKIFFNDFSFTDIFLHKPKAAKINKYEALFTKDELSKFDGRNSDTLYLSILGDVYDVSTGKKYYGPGQTYHAFTGKDASRSFVTGNFDPDQLSDEVADLKPDDLLSLKHWKDFYAKEYKMKGKLIGRYFDENGVGTKYAEVVNQLIKNAERTKLEKNEDEILYPPCNIAWDVETGTKIWCTNQSGGISRAWTGFPRKYFKPGSNSHRCACIKEGKNDPKVAEYEGCEQKSTTCYIKE